MAGHGTVMARSGMALACHALAMALHVLPRTVMDCHGGAMVIRGDAMGFYGTVLLQDWVKHGVPLSCRSEY